MPENTGMANTPKWLKWQILAFMTWNIYKTCESKTLLPEFSKYDTGINHLIKYILTFQIYFKIILTYEGWSINSRISLILDAELGVG